MGRNELHDALQREADEVLALPAAHPASVAEKTKSGNLPLHVALSNKAEPEVMSALLAAHPTGAAEKDSTGNLPLHLAFMKHAVPEVLSLLLAAHPTSAAEENTHGYLPLHLALANKAAPEVVSALLEAHPSGAAKKNIYGHSPLHLALANKAAPEVVFALLAAHAAGAAEKNKDGYLPLYLALDKNAVPEVLFAQLAAHPAGAAEEDKDGNLPLHLAMRNKAALEMVAAMLAAHPAGVSQRDKSGNLLLHLALSNKAAPEVVSALLVAHPPSAAEKDTNGNSPLHLVAANQAVPEVVAALLAAHPPGMAETNKDGDLPLHWALRRNAVPEVMLALLAAHPAGAARKDMDGHRPLHMALRNKAAPEVVLALLAAYPTGVTWKDMDGFMPLHFVAANQAAPAVVFALLMECPEIAAEKDRRGCLPLHWAATKQAVPEVVSALLAAQPGGAAVKDWDGYLPLHLAAENKAAPEVIYALLATHPAGAAEKDRGGRLATHRIAHWFSADERSRFAGAVAQHRVARAWHGVVKVEAFAPAVRQIVAADPSLAFLADGVGPTALDEAIGACRKAMVEATAFLGRYTIKKIVHTSATCTVLLARDEQALAGAATIVALKLMRDEGAFLCEVQPRMRHTLREQFVVGILRVHISAPAAPAPVSNNTDAGGGGSGGSDGGCGGSGHAAAAAAAAASAAAAAAEVEARRLLALCEGVEGHIHTASSFGTTGAVEGREPYNLCVVMHRGERSPHGALLHDNFAGANWHKIEAITFDVFRALAHIHWKGMVHGDYAPPPRPPPSQPPSNIVVTPAEVRAAATHSKPGTAPGLDGIPVDVWRKLGKPAFELLAAVFTAVGATGGTPPGFLDGVIASIYKAKNAADAANYRPLTMLGSDYRILAKVLATRWTPLLSAVVGPEQTAFLAGRRISDNICLKQMLPGLLAANAAEGVGPTGAALALLDFRKAYDTIDRGFLIAVMEAVGVGDGVLAWTRTILTHTYASAEVNGFISAPRKYAAGVRQGCPAAPALFLFLGHALACFLRTCPAVGVEVVPGCRVTCPQYADDCMPLLRSCAPADVAALVETMAVFGRATGLVLNLGKCGILPLGSAGEGLLAGAEVAGLRVLDAGVSLGVPVSAGLPPPEGVTGVCRERLAAAYTKLARFPMSAFGRGHAAATYGVSRILFRAVHCGMTPEAERVLSRWTATLVDRSVGPDPPAELPRWASSVPGPAPSRTALLALGPVARITGRVQTAELWGAEAPLWANPLLQLELPAAQRSVQWREPTGDAAGHALFSPTDAARWLVDGLARVRDALPGMRTVTDLCVLWAWLAAVDMVFAGLRGLEAAVPTLWRMPLLNARKEPIWRLWPPARSVAVERAGELATMDLWDALASFAEGGGMPRGWAGVVGPTHPFVGVVDGGLTLNKTS
ncbi:hypothetical protein FOA52_004258 [Chlamydomonas sp. UWO 241]|nr:hypothetical protein FOA52_004258 [Chlamydomonas sp. UWO 241]